MDEGLLIVGASVIGVVLVVLLLDPSNNFRSVLFILCYSFLLIQLLRAVFQPFASMVLNQLAFVPFSELLLVCAFALFFSKAITTLLEQINLKSLAPITEITIRFMLFVYCFEQLVPVLKGMQKLFSSFT